MVSAYGNPDTIDLTLLPVAYLDHRRHILALFDHVLRFRE